MQTYLCVCYGLMSLNHLMLYFGVGIVTNRDVLLLILSPLTIPVTVLVKLASHVVDLDAPCFYRPR